MRRKSYCSAKMPNFYAALDLGQKKVIAAKQSALTLAVFLVQPPGLVKAVLAGALADLQSRLGLMTPGFVDQLLELPAQVPTHRLA